MGVQRREGRGELRGWSRPTRRDWQQGVCHRRDCFVHHRFAEDESRSRFLVGAMLRERSHQAGLQSVLAAVRHGPQRPG